MLGIGEKLPEFTVTGVKPKFMQHEQNGESAFEPITQDSFEGKWKVIFFYPKDFTFVCPTEIAEFARLSGDFEDLPIWQFADTRGELVDGLGVREPSEGVAYRATYVVDPHNVIQHVYVTNLNVGRSPADTLRVLDALQTDELCPCNRPVGGDILEPAA